MIEKAIALGDLGIHFQHEAINVKLRILFFVKGKISYHANKIEIIMLWCYELQYLIYVMCKIFITYLF